MNNKLPVIFEYLDFRTYLEDYRLARSKIDEYFTHYYICHYLGMKNSRSYFNNITSGRKNIGEDTVEKIISLLELPKKEAKYFRILVNYNQVEHPVQKEGFYEQLIKLKNTPGKIIPKDCYEYFTTWYHPVVRGLLEGFTVNDNFEELGNKLLPPISAEEARESVLLLGRLNLIEKTENGDYMVIEKFVQTDPETQVKLVEQFQLCSLERASDRIKSRPKEHKTSTLTITLSPDGFKKILEQLDQFKSAVRSIAHEDPPSDKKVYELITHLSKQSN
jgi:uncharacterized protein (TIGR02147 family)